MTVAALILLLLTAPAATTFGGLSSAWQRPAANPTPLPLFIRGMYGRDSTCQAGTFNTDNGCVYGTGLDNIVTAQFNTVQTNPWPEALAAVAAKGLKAIVWVGGWSNKKCSWNLSDLQLSERVNSVKASAAIVAYYLADEPLFSYCPNAPAAFARRTAAVHRLDPGSRTFAVIPDWDRGPVDYLRWQNAVDMLGVNLYPCHFFNGQNQAATPKARQPCEFAGVVDNGIRRLEQAGITGYLGVLQDFQDCYYELPTNEELRIQMTHWQQLAFHMAGYLVFAWNFTGNPCTYGSLGINLDQVPGNVAALTDVNTHFFRRGIVANA